MSRVPLVGWKPVTLDPYSMGDCDEGGFCGIEMLEVEKCKNLKDFGNLAGEMDESTVAKFKKKSKKPKRRKRPSSAGDNKPDRGIKKRSRKKRQKAAGEKKQEFSVISKDEGDDVNDAWQELGLDPILLSAIRSCGFKFPLPIQSYCIPAAVKKRKDVLGAAQTGSGKTLAFGIPIFQRLLEEKSKSSRNKTPRRPSPKLDRQAVAEGRSQERKNIPDPLLEADEEMIEVASEDELVEVTDESEEVTSFEDIDEMRISESEREMLNNKLGTIYLSDLMKKADPETCLKALILTPTRELALQVFHHLKPLGVQIGIRIVPIVGGMAPQKQERLLGYNPEIVVATPGRFLDLYTKGTAHLRDLSQLRFFVVDECDKMIRHGDFKDLTTILQFLPEYQHIEETFDGIAKRNHKLTKQPEYRIPSDQRKMQTLLFSATLTLPRSLHRKLRGSQKEISEADDVDEMALALDRLRFRGEPEVVDLTSKAKLADRIQEAYLLCPEEKSDAAVYSIIMKHPGRTLVFCNSIKNVRRLAELLKLLNIPAHPIHARKQQSQRLKALDRFRDNENSVMVATDVAARGLDIPDIRCVIHYNVPRAADLYIHRSGRTARVDADGLALSLVVPSETLRFNSLFKVLKRDLPPAFPLDQSVMQESEARVRLAKRIRDIESKISFSKKDAVWNERAVRALQRDEETPESVSSSEDDEEQTRAELERLKTELAKRLADPLDRMDSKFFTGKVIPAVKGATEELRRKSTEAFRENITKARKFQAKIKPKSKAEIDRLNIHKAKLAEILNKKDKKRQKLFVIPPALGREATGPDALQVVRDFIKRRQG